MRFLTQYFLQNIKVHQKQKFVTAGGFDGCLRDKAMYVESTGGPKIDNSLLKKQM